MQKAFPAPIGLWTQAWFRFELRRFPLLWQPLRPLSPTLLQGKTLLRRFRGIRQERRHTPTGRAFAASPISVIFHHGGGCIAHAEPPSEEGIGPPSAPPASNRCQRRPDRIAKNAAPGTSGGPFPPNGRGLAKRRQGLVRRADLAYANPGFAERFFQNWRGSRLVHRFRSAFALPLRSFPRSSILPS